MRRDVTLAGLVALVMLSATHSLTRVFTTGDWRPDVYLAIAVAIGLAAISRALRLGGIVATVVSGIGLAAVVYIAHLPFDGFLPGRQSLADFTDLLGAGFEQLQQQPAPTAPLFGLVLIVVVATWVIAFATHELLVRARRPGPALIPAAVLWAVPLAMPQPVGQTWPFAIPFMAACMLVLLVDANADLGSLSRGSKLGRVPMGGLAVGTAALAIAAIAPALLPGYGDQAFIDNLSEDPRGYQPIVDVGDRLQLPEERDVLELTSTRPAYLRIAALDAFDGRTWIIGPAGEETFRPPPEALTRGDKDLPPEEPIAVFEEVRTDVRVLDLVNIYVPVPYQPVRMTGPNRRDFVYSSVGGFVIGGVDNLTQRDFLERAVPAVVEGFEYGVVSSLPTPTIAQLQATSYTPAQIEAGTQLPRRDWSGYRELAAEVFDQAGAETAFEKAFALQQWFVDPALGGFRYTVDDIASLNGAGAADRFLFDTRAGYCEYFSTAMALMLRSSGIPARVAVGFLPGRQLEDATLEGTDRKRYRVSTSDAHAWVEVLFPDYGWIKFDPTPRSDGATIPPTLDDADPVNSMAQRAAIESGELEPEPAPTSTDDDILTADDDLPRGVDATDPATAGGGIASGTGWPVAVALLLLLTATALAVSWRQRTHPSAGLVGADRVLAVQRRVLNVAAGYGLPRQSSETATELSARWAERGYVALAPAMEFAMLAQAAAFGGELDPSDGTRADQLGDQIVASLRDSVTTQTKLFAPIRVPAEKARTATRSTLHRVKRLVGR